MKARVLADYRLLAALSISLAGAAVVSAAPIVPGSGTVLTAVGDDFEDPEWKFIPNLPKSSADIDKQTRMPAGYSKNGRWRENVDRGQPDLVTRIPTPEGGLPFSEGALLLSSRATGIPGHPDRKSEQDDIFMCVNTRIGHYIPVGQGPSVVVRVYLAPFEEWEARTGSTFALRATVRGSKPGKSETEPYWPGIFVNYKRPENRRKNEAPAAWVIRPSVPGGDYMVRPIKETGWYTLGMSFSSDGMIHYYIRKGIEDLTESDRVASQNPYSFQCLYFIDVFFDVFGSNDGRTWTTGWVIDDPAVYLLHPPAAKQQTVRRPRPSR